MVVCKSEASLGFRYLGRVTFQMDLVSIRSCPRMLIQLFYTERIAVFTFLRDYQVHHQNVLWIQFYSGMSWCYKKGLECSSFNRNALHATYFRIVRRNLDWNEIYLDLIVGSAFNNWTRMWTRIVHGRYRLNLTFNVRLKGVNFVPDLSLTVMIQ